MDKSMSREFIKIIHSLRKLTHSHRPNVKVHPGEFMMLASIHGCMEDKEKNHLENRGVKVGEISELIHSTKPATSKMLKAVEDKGYIERVTDAKDRRVVYIRLSETGETIIKDAMNRMYDFADRTIQRIGEDDMKELIRLMNIFYQAMAEELDERG